MAASMVSVTAGKRVVAVMGAGPGIGRSVALRFAREGFAVALLARSVDKLATLAHDIRQLQARTHAQHDRIARSPSVSSFSCA
jgi:NADP-dependent 3-hydroxy acid dehydrogenase YdfG